MKDLLIAESLAKQIMKHPHSLNPSPVLGDSSQPTSLFLTPIMKMKNSSRMMVRRKRSRQISLLGIRKTQEEIKKERACRAKISLLLDLLEFEPHSQQSVASAKMKKRNKNNKNNKNNKAVKKKASKDSRKLQEPKYVMHKGTNPLKLMITKVSPSETYNKDNEGNKQKYVDVAVDDEHKVTTSKIVMVSNSQAEPDKTCAEACSEQKEAPFDFDLNLPPAEEF